MKWILLALLILLVTIMWLFWRARANEARFEASHPPIGRMIDVNGHPVHVAVSGSGPPIVLIHGASGNLRDMTFDLAPDLAAGFTTISLDRPGLGYTPAFDPAGETLKEQAAIVAGVIRALGYERAYILGQSFGGSVALAMALDHADVVAGLILISAPSNVWEGGLDPLYKLNANPLSGPVFRLLVAAIPPRGIVRNSLAGIFAPQPIMPGYGEYIGTGLTLRRATLRANALQVAALKPQIAAMVPRYGEISLPVIAIHGTADEVVPYKVHMDKLKDQIKGIEVITLAGIGHMPHHVRRGEVVGAVMRMHKSTGLAANP